MVRVTVLALTVSCTATLAVASDARTTVGAVVGASSQGAGKSDSPYLGPGFGGTAVGVIGYCDVLVHSAVTVGGEASFAGHITGMQSQRDIGGSNVFLSRHHDSVLSLIVKWQGASPRVHFAVGGGAGFAVRDTERDGTFIPYYVGSGQEHAVHETVSNIVFATTGAADGAISLSDHFQVVALVRVHALWDGDRQKDGVVRRGVSSLVLRYGAGGQVRF